MSTCVGLLKLLGPLRRQLAFALLLSACALLSGIALTAVAAYLIARAATVADIAALSIAFAAVRGLAVARAGLRYAERFVSHKLTLGVLVRIRAAFYAAVEPLAPAALTRYRTGDLLARAMADVQTLEGFYIRALLPPIAGAIAVAAAFLVLASFAFAPAVLVVTLLFIAGFVLPVARRRRENLPAQKMVESRGEMQGVMVDHVRGTADLLVFDSGGRHRRKLEALGAEVEDAQAQVASVRALNSFWLVLLSSLASLGVLWLATPLVESGRLSAVYLAMLVLAAVASFEAVQGMSGVLQQLDESKTAGQRIFELVDRPNPEATTKPHAPLPGNLAVEFRQVRFRYSTESREVLRDYSLSIPAGKKVAVIGPSGCGKTTLMNLLLRFWEPQGGQITLGGVELELYDREELRSLIGVVPQDIHLFNCTLADNLRVADADADLDRLEDACARAVLSDFVASRPDRLDTLVGENGLLLSAGERQRLAVARMLLRDAPFFILDEPTANLDVETERLLIESLRHELAGKTGLIITHRPAVCALADEVVEMSAGRIVRRLTAAA